jgi:general secretion pathway protein D
MNRYWTAAVAAAFLIFSTASGLRADNSHVPPDQITMNFQNVDIPVLAKFISEITGRNFIVDESVRGKVSIISPTKVTPEQAYSIFQSVLQIKGYTTIKAGKVIKIVPARNVRSGAPLTVSQEPAEVRGDEYVTRMIRLKNIDASSLVSVVQPMVSHDGLVAAFPQDNTLILTDDAYNVQRLLKIIGTLDVHGIQQNVAVIPLKLAFADQLAPEIEQIMSARGETTESPRRPPRPGIGVVAPTATGSSGSFKVIPDERTNSLVVLAPPLQMKEIKEIISKLDIQPPNATSRIHVYRLKNAQALEMVDVLNNLLNGGSAPTTLSPTTGRGSLGRGSTLGTMGGGGYGGMGGGYGGMGGGYGGMGGGGYGGGMGGGFGSGFGGGMGGGMGGAMGGGMGMMRGSGGSGGNTHSASASTGGAGKNPNFTYAVDVTADPATNALVISASPQDWQTLKQIIDELDVPRVQVFVQAVIVEVSAQRSKELGVNFMASTGISNSTLGVGQLNFGQLQNALGNPLGLSGLGLGLASGSTCSIPSALASTAVSAVAGSATSGTATSGTVTAPCDVALLLALETDSHTDVLSAPTLLTADNTEAMIVIGQNLPFVGSAAANAGLPGQIFNSVERQNVGITLDMVPQVSQGDYVRLDLYEEVSNVLGNTVNNPLGPTTTIRSASTTVVVQNNRTAVLGGLLATQDQQNNQGVPFISHIPVIGNLFSYKQNDKQKDNLLVFLTPHIVRNREQLRSLALDERQKYVESLGRREMHDMPASQIQQLYKPSFSIAVPPSPLLGRSGGVVPPAAPSPGSGVAPINPLPPSGSRATPFNTEEIGPSSMKAPSGGAYGVAAAGGATTSGADAAAVPVSSRGSATTHALDGAHSASAASAP